MSDNMINVDPRERLLFAQKLVNFETDMKAAIKSLKDRLNDAAGQLEDPGSKHYIAESRILVEELEALFDGSITDVGNTHKGKAQAQIQLMDDFAGKMSR